MNTCATCKWFYRDFTQFKAGNCRGLAWIPADASHGSGTESGPAIIRADVLPYGITQRWRDAIIVTEDFGCIHHQPKDQTNGC